MCWPQQQDFTTEKHDIFPWCGIERSNACTHPVAFKTSLIIYSLCNLNKLTNMCVSVWGTPPPKMSVIGCLWHNIHVLSILQVILIGTLLSYPSLALGGGLICVCLGYPTTQNVCHWLFLTYIYVLSILHVILIGTLLSYPSLALGGGGTNMCLSGTPHHPKCLSLVVCDTLVCT